MVPYLAFFAAGDFTIARGVHRGLPWLVAVSQAAEQGRRGGQHAPDEEDPGRRRRASRRTSATTRSRSSGGLTTVARRRLRAGEPDPPDLPRGRRQLHQPRRPRARPPVVRRRHRRPAVARHLAQRGLRDLHGVALVGDRTAAAPAAQILRRLLRQRRRRARTSGRSSSPTPAPRRSSTTPIYGRGAMTLQALRNRVGDRGLLADPALVAPRADGRQRLDRGVRGARGADQRRGPHRRSSRPGCAPPSKPARHRRQRARLRSRATA